MMGSWAPAKRSFSQKRNDLHGRVVGEKENAQGNERKNLDKRKGGTGFSADRHTARAQHSFRASTERRKEIREGNFQLGGEGS